MTNPSNTPLRFTTLRVGVATLDVAGRRIALDTRVLAGSDGAYYVLAAGTLSEPLPGADAATARAMMTPEPAGAAVDVAWRDRVEALGPDERPCPVCAAPALGSPRYPRAVCPACVLEATDAAGRSLRFYNEGFGGGLLARYADDGARYDGGGACFVRRWPCVAEEHRFGGIVVQRVPV